MIMIVFIIFVVLVFTRAWNKACIMNAKVKLGVTKGPGGVWRQGILPAEVYVRWIAKATHYASWAVSPGYAWYI